MDLYVWWANDEEGGRGMEHIDWVSISFRLSGTIISYFPFYSGKFLIFQNVRFKFMFFSSQGKIEIRNVMKFVYQKTMKNWNKL
jgi:hypothetical protein